MNDKKLVAGHNGFMVKRRPGKYKITESQEVMRQIVQKCGIKKGIKKAELQKMMKECVGPKMREYYSKETQNDKG